jgi:hypothetical protein
MGASFIKMIFLEKEKMGFHYRIKIYILYYDR